MKKKGNDGIRLPNRYGSVRKLSGKRRNPCTVPKTIGYELDHSEEIKNADMVLKKIMDLDLPVQNLTTLYNIAKKMKRKNIEMTIEALEKERKKLEE